MKHLKFFVGLLFIVAVLIPSGATMAQTLIIQPTPERPDEQPPVVPQRDSQPQQPVILVAPAEPTAVPDQRPQADQPDQPPANPDRDPQADPQADPQFQVQPTATTPPQRGVDELVSVTDAPPTLVPASQQCYDDNGDGVTDNCWCASNDGECLAELVAECSAWDGHYLEPGPDNTACWKNEFPLPPTNDATREPGVNDLVISTPSPGIVLPLNCTDNDEDGDADTCWCESSNGECLIDLVAWCQGDGDMLIGGTETTTCHGGQNDGNGPSSGN